VKPLARRYHELGDGINQRSAWGKAVHQRLQWAKRQRKDTDGDSNGSQQNPLDIQQQLLHDNQMFDFTALEKVMECDAAWGISTCGVERRIGDYRHIFGKQEQF